MGERLFYSTLISIGIVFAWRYIINIIFQVIFGDFGAYLSVFATIIFIIVYCTLTIISKISKCTEK